MEKTKRLIAIIWRMLGSTSLAALLLAALLLASALAGLFPQAPAEPADREPWLAAVAQRYDSTTGLLDDLRLFDAYRSPWYLGLLAAVVLNGLVCSLQRVARLWQSLAPSPTHPRSDALRQAASLLGHLAATALIVAIAVRPTFATEQGGITLLPGQTYPLQQLSGQFGRYPGILITARAPVLDHTDDSRRGDLRVPLVLSAQGLPAVTVMVSINHPVSFHGLGLHLEGYGPAAQVIAPEGTFAVALPDDMVQELTLPRDRLNLKLAYQAEGPALYVEALDASGARPTPLGSGLVADGEQIQVREVPITLRLTWFTTWLVTSDPTFGPAIGTAGLLLAAVLASLWLPSAGSRRRALAGSPEADDQRAAGVSQAVTQQAGLSSHSMVTWLGTGMAVILAGLLAGIGLRAGQWPVSTGREVALAFALTTTLAALGAAVTSKGGTRWAAQLALGLAVALSLYAWLGASAVQPGGSLGGLPLLDSVWFPLHVGATVAGCGALALAGASGVAWLARPVERPAAAQLLGRAVTVGYPLLTLALLLGMVWGQLAWGRSWGWDLKEVWALVVWLVYTLYWHVRRRPRWQGRRLAWLAVAGLAVLLFGLLGLDWLARSVGVLLP